MNCAKITSPSNSKIKEALDIKNKRSKYKHNAFIIEGPHLIEMAITSGHRIKEVFFTSAFASKKDGQRLLRQLSKKSNEIFTSQSTGEGNKNVIPRFNRGIQENMDSRLRTAGMTKKVGFSVELLEVSDQVLNKFTDTETPQGIIAIASYTQKNLNELTFKTLPLLIIIDGIREPGNLGTIIRTSDAAGADAVIILPGACDVFMQKTLRATAGSIFNIPIVYVEIDELVKWLKAKKITLAATALDAEKSIFSTDLKIPLAFVFGNEAHGVSDEMKGNAALILKIPIFGKAESLNVSASAAVCLYEVIRQRL